MFTQTYITVTLLLTVECSVLSRWRVLVVDIFEPSGCLNQQLLCGERNQQWNICVFLRVSTRETGRFQHLTISTERIIQASRTKQHKTQKGDAQKDEILLRCKNRRDAMISAMISIYFNDFQSLRNT